MLTDRQQKFYSRISELSDSDVTDAERENLKRAKKWLDRGDDFRVVINSLCLGLQSLESERLQGELSPEVKSLFDNLIEAYGEPLREEVRIIGPSVGLDRGISRSFVLGGVGAFIIILVLISTMYLSRIISLLGKTGTIVLYITCFAIALSLILIPDKKSSSEE